MNKNVFLILAAAIAMGGVVPMGYAETAPASPAPIAVTSAPTPVINTSEGTVSALDVQSAAPWIKIKDAVGKEWTIMINPASSSAWKGGSKAAWTDVKVGDKVKVRHTEKDDKAFAKTVEIT